MVDLALVDGDLSVPSRLVSGVDLVVQRFTVRANQWLGDWILDVRKGLPMERWLQTKPAPLDEMVAALRAEASTTPGVTSVTSANGSFVGHRIQILIEAVAEGQPITLSVSSDTESAASWVIAWRPSGRYIPR